MRTELGPVGQNTEPWGLAMVEQVIRYFHDPNGPSERDTRAMQRLVEDFRRFERIVHNGGVEHGDARKLAWGFIKFERNWLKERPTLYRLYRQTMANERGT